MALWLVLLGIVIPGLSGIPALLLGRSGMSGHWTSALLAVLGTGLGLCGIGTFWATDTTEVLVWPWRIPGAEFSVGMDGVSALFLLPIFLISLLGNVYGLAYWKQKDHPHTGRKLRLFYGSLTAGMALVVIARNSILFLFGWEAMALSAYFLITTQDDEKEVQGAGWIYFVATHTATLCLFALFALLRGASHSFALTPLMENSLTPGMATAVFGLALAAFGLKAGLMPLHVWLPGAHASAPSHVSAIMSGVMIKMGVYGLVRITSLFPLPPLYWGEVVLALGVVSGVLGVAFAIGQHDLKRLLAYHSIENIGIIVMGLGLALVGRSLARVDWVILGLGGALLHVWNHAFFKALLFLSAGSVIHASHTREIDDAGGLAKRMPWTAGCFLVGAVAICGLPPLNGFISEFLIYLGLFGTLGSGEGTALAGTAFAVPALAMVGALAVACFVKVYGAVFLGTARSEQARHARESPPAMIGPMGVLVACCFLLGLAPRLIAPVLGKAISAWAPDLDDAGSRLLTLAPLDKIGSLSLALLAAMLAAGAGLWLCSRKSGVREGATWGCGYIAPTPRMQYTSSSFAQMVVELFAWALRPRIHRPRDLPFFPQEVSFHSDVPDTVLDEAVLPAIRAGARLFSWFRVFQGGSVQAYLLYIFLALIGLMLWR
jgi:hydrogenase-4 component B